MNPVEIRGQQLFRSRRRLKAVAASIAAAVMLAGIGYVALAQPIIPSGDPSVAAAPPAAPVDMSRVQATEVFSESFEGASVNQWVLTGHAGGPRWNLVTNTQHAGLYIHLAHSPVRAMWFGDPATGLYGTAGGDVPPAKDPVYSGTLTYNTPFAIPAGDTWAFLTFWSWEFTEMSETVSGHRDNCFGQSTCQFDVRQVWISGTNDITWTLKWSTDVNGTVEQTWHRVAVDVSEYIGQSVRVRFAFTTDPLGEDGRSNNARGWYVDDVTLFTFTPTDFIYLPLIARNN